MRSSYQTTIEPTYTISVDNTNADDVDDHTPLFFAEEESSTSRTTGITRMSYDSLAYSASTVNSQSDLLGGLDNPSSYHNYYLNYHNNSQNSIQVHGAPTATSTATLRTKEDASYSGMTAESLRLNAVHQNQQQQQQKRNRTTTSRQYRQQHWSSQPKIRAWFIVSLMLTFVTILLVILGHMDGPGNDYDDEDGSGSMMPHHRLSQLWEMGLSGLYAQHLAQTSLVHHVPSSSKSSDSKKKFQVDLLGKSKPKLIIPNPPPMGCETTVLLLRHCEKGSIRSHCDYHGFERAAYLATLFGDTPKERWPAPKDIYALSVGGRGAHKKKKNFREVETVEPLAKKLKIEMNQDFTERDRSKLTRKVLESILKGEQCGELTVISWKHSELPKVARELGCGPLQGCPWDYRGKEFDQVWQIKFVYDTFLHGRKSKETKPHWEVLGAVEYEHFDPLAFSKQSGDYPKGGTDEGAHWATKSQDFFT